MNAYLDGKVIFNNIPDNLTPGDTIISKCNAIYEIVTKTFDLNNNELYCKIILYEKPNNGDNVIDILENIYDSPFFETSGANTNEIDNNPRIIILMGILSVLMDKEVLVNMAKIYKDTIVLRWNDIKIKWQDILSDNPVSVRPLKEALPIIQQILINTKISSNIWPSKLQKS